jgi:DNA-binding IclR family transcriptional regulator
MRTTGIQVLDRALTILEIIGKSPDDLLGPAELAREAGINAATCSRILKSLLDRGYVEQPERKKGYRLGSMAFALTGGEPYRKDLVNRCVPVIDAMATELDESTLLAVMRRGERIVLYEAESHNQVQVRREPQQIIDPLTSATGRLLLAWLQPDKLNHLALAKRLPTKAWPEVRNSEELCTELDKIRREGHALRHTGSVVGLAFPIREKGEVTAALGLHLPAYRFTGEHQRRIMERLKTGSLELSAD